MGWIHGKSSVHRCPPLPVLWWPQTGRMVTCAECGTRYVVQGSRWVWQGVPPKPSNRIAEEIAEDRYDA